MTTQPEQPTPPPAVVPVTPAADSKLEQLHAVYAQRKAEADAATKALKEVTDGIKAELTAAAPDQPKVALSSAYGPPLQLTWVESWRVDATKLKAERPDIYVLFAKQSGTWQLKPAKGGAE